MKKIDGLIKEFLIEKVAGSRLERTPECPTEAKLSDYLHNLLSKEQSELISDHVAQCLYCLEQLDLAQRGSKAAKWSKTPGPSTELIRKVKEAASRPLLKRLAGELEEGTPTSPRGKFSRMLAGLKKNKWLIASLMAFAVSFFFQRFFLQFLVLAVILGAKWVFDTATTRTLIMIYDAWRKRRKEEPEDEDILKKLEKRIEKRQKL